MRLNLPDRETMQLSGVRLSVCLSHHSPAARRCCGLLLSAIRAEDIGRLPPGARQ